MSLLLPALDEPSAQEAVRFGSEALSYRELAAAASGVASAVDGLERVAIFAESKLATAVGVVGALRAGVTVVPINPRIGHRELDHIVRDARPPAVVASASAELPEGLAALRRVDVDRIRGTRTDHPIEPGPEAPALILYTSGTTGSPKGAILSRRAVAANLDALAQVWAWTAADVLVQGLPLFHAHGLVLGMLGPLRIGGRLVHLGRFSPEAAAAALAGDGTMLFGVPTMYGRAATAAEGDPDVARGLGSARLLVSGSAALPAREHERIERATGQRIVERYGLTETLMNCSVRVDGDRRPGHVGPPLPGVDVRLVDDEGQTISRTDEGAMGEVYVRGPNLFSGYLNREEATADAVGGGWFRTGDLASWARDDYLRIVGRKATDLIKTGGYKVGAGEVEGALLEHAGVLEAAVTGEPDDDLGELIVAWVVRRGSDVRADDLASHVATMLSPHKRPRAVRFLPELPRNAMGKVVKARLGEDLPGPRD